MRTGRADYDQLIRNKDIPPGEPTFRLRAQDAAGAETVRAWAALARDAGTPAAVVEQALQQADAMDAWPGPKKPADADHLTTEEQQQLEYQFSRRAWRARPDGRAAGEILLAERRGHDLALNTLRAEVRRELEAQTRRLVLARTALAGLLGAPDDPDSREAAGEALRLTEGEGG